MTLRAGPATVRLAAGGGGRTACRAALTGPAAAGDPDLAEWAGTMDAFRPLQRARRLTFATEAAEAAAAEAANAEAAIAEAVTGEAAHTADALAAWDAATQAWDGLGQPYSLARSLLRAARAAIDRRDRDGAAERLARRAAGHVEKSTRSRMCGLMQRRLAGRRRDPAFAH